MKFSVIESMYFRNFAKKFRTQEIKDIKALALESESELVRTRPTNRTRISEIVRDLALQSHYMGLLEKHNHCASKGGDKGEGAAAFDNLAVIITSAEDIETGNRGRLPLRLIKGLADTGIRHFGIYCCEEGQSPDMNTYAVILDTPPDSALHKELLDSSANLNLDIRITSTEWFKD